MPAVLGLTPSPAAEAATVLNVEGTFQPPKTTQKGFKGAFCEHNSCKTVNTSPGLGDAFTGAMALQAAAMLTPGDLIIMGYSVGASSIYERLRTWDVFPGVAPDPNRVVLLVTYGNPESKYGGQAKDFPGTGLPEDLPYKVLNVTMQYDSVADRPDRFGLFSLINLSFANHFAYKNIDINDPRNLVYQDEDGTTYMLVKAEVLPMLQFVSWFASESQMAQLDAIFRPLVERDYDRPAYVEQGEGADWGNGLPPASLQGSDRQAERRTVAPAADPVIEESADGSVDAADEPLIDSSGTEPLAADVSADLGEPVDDAVELEESVDLDELQDADLTQPDIDEQDDDVSPDPRQSAGTTPSAGGDSDSGSTARSESRRSERASAAS
ncbi:PE-PPE domain-containing protein [Mycobacterium sp. SMC-4]|uniref:PE-PPE domain-containing protein n=1 Tax=Mycobacterium sp. SMC-4 TaxID=2857059 RepID=UPI0021B44A5A|nr:PE-PPE domain-containing protein [Mycobacterium sp. SMC-4]